MALDFYDSNGQPYAYTDDGETIYTFGGVPIAFIDGDSIYSFSGTHMAFFEDGQVWDHSGGVSLFTGQASGGPMKPLKALKPIKGLKSLKPLKGLKALKPLKPLKTLGWSSATPQDIFGA